MRAVIDTNLLISAMISKPGSTSRRLLEAIRDGRLTLILSRPLIDEFLDVMGRPKFARYGITIGDVLDFIAGLLALASVVQITGSARGCEDPDDDAVIETAEVGAAHYLITGDADLLDSRIQVSLGRMGIEVMTASDFLHASRVVPWAIDQARMIVAICSSVALPKLTHSFGQVTVALRGCGASASVAALSASVTLKLIKPGGTAIDIDPNIGYLPAPPGD